MVRKQVKQLQVTGFEKQQQQLLYLCLLINYESPQLHLNNVLHYYVFLPILNICLYGKVRVE